MFGEEAKGELRERAKDNLENHAGKVGKGGLFEKVAKRENAEEGDSLESEVVD